MYDILFNIDYNNKLYKVYLLIWMCEDLYWLEI